jgi:cytochrome c oxidase subunit 2
MIMGQAFARMKFGFLALMAAVFVLATPQVSLAQEVDAAADDAAAATVEGAADAAVYTPMAPTDGKGMPVDRGLTFQDQYTADGAYALWMHDWILLPVITAISLFVLALLLWVIVRYNRRANPIPSKNTHNTAIEVIWTVIPALILVVIAVPSITLLARQYETPPADAITIKAVGYQWYWGYEYPDHDIELVSNMLDENEALTSGEPHQLAVDNRMVVPVGVPLRIQTTAADVIHAFAVPSLWFKQDAVPGRLNERMLVIDEPGVYYGQCSELCGSLHGFMPIAVEAVPMEDFEKWVASKGGTLPGAEAAAEAAPATEGEAEAAPAA